MKTGRTIAVLALFLTGCALRAGSFPPDVEGRRRLSIVVTVYPLAEFAREIAGDRSAVVLLLPPGADVHTWQPRISDVRRIETADLLVSIGQDLEPWLEDLVKGIPKARFVRLEASRGLKLIPADEENGPADREHGRFDPHVWLDFGNDEKIAAALASALTRLDPAGGPLFARRAEALRDRFRRLDAEFARDLGPCRGRRFLLAGHAAFAYLARRYGLIQAALYGASPDAAPTPRELAAAISRARREGVKTVFYEPSTGDKTARMIAAELGASVFLLHPGHVVDPARLKAGATFFTLMRENLENLRHGLGCR